MSFSAPSTSSVPCPPTRMEGTWKATLLRGSAVDAVVVKRMGIGERGGDPGSPVYRERQIKKDGDQFSHAIAIGLAFRYNIHWFNAEDHDKTVAAVSCQPST